MTRTKHGRTLISVGDLAARPAMLSSDCSGLPPSCALSITSLALSRLQLRPVFQMSQLDYILNHLPRMEIVIVYRFVEINGIIGSFDDNTVFLRKSFILIKLYNYSYTNQ